MRSATRPKNSTVIEPEMNRKVLAKAYSVRDQPNALIIGSMNSGPVVAWT